MLYFTADCHFHHKNVIKYCDRPFRDIEEMDKKLIRNWNEVVTAKDEVYILGDFTFKGLDAVEALLSQLKGTKHLVRGNHDSTFRDSMPYASDVSYAEIQYQNQWFILSHYPFLSWNGMHRGSIQLHGHQHNTCEYNLDCLEKEIRRYDVGVDANCYKPVSAESIIDFFIDIES